MASITGLSHNSSLYQSLRGWARADWEADKCGVGRFCGGLTGAGAGAAAAERPNLLGDQSRMSFGLLETGVFLSVSIRLIKVFWLFRFLELS